MNNFQRRTFGLALFLSALLPGSACYWLAQSYVLPLAHEYGWLGWRGVFEFYSDRLIPSLIAAITFLATAGMSGIGLYTLVTPTPVHHHDRSKC